MDKMKTKVFLWTAPRCVSTAFERSIMELPSTKVFHEPFSAPYYFGPEMISKRYAEKDPDPEATFSNIHEMLQSDYEGKDVIFVKDMAYYVENHHEDFLGKEYAGFQHTFLVRKPRKAIPSLYKSSIDVQSTGFDYFDPDEAGYKQLFDLFNFISLKFGYKPIVVDADDLLDDPEGIMRSYCSKTGLPFDVSMLKWDPVPIPEWRIWNGWHDAVEKSTGFRKREPQKGKKDNVDVSELPLEVQKSIESSMKFYEDLTRHSIEAVHNH